MAQSPVVQIHTHASGEQGLFANAYLVETTRGVVVIDATLTHTESRALARFPEVQWSSCPRAPFLPLST